MSIWDSQFFFPHEVGIRALQRGGGLGDSHLPSKTSRAEVLDEQTLVRDADGAEVVSSTKVTVPLATIAPLGSLVTVWAGTSRAREARVLAVASEINTRPLPDFLVLRLE